MKYDDPGLMERYACLVSREGLPARILLSEARSGFRREWLRSLVDGLPGRTKDLSPSIPALRRRMLGAWLWLYYYVDADTRLAQGRGLTEEDSGTTGYLLDGDIAAAHICRYKQGMPDIEEKALRPSGREWREAGSAAPMESACSRTGCILG